MNAVDAQPGFEDIARDLAQPVMRYLERYAGNRAVAEDLWQETLIRVHRGLPAFAGRSSVRTWVFAIANHVAADYFREPERRARVVELDEAAELVDTDCAISERLVVDEMNTCVRQVIDGLPDAYRSALVLHELEGLSAEQTAEICGCSVATAKIRIHRARLRLKEALKSQCDFYRDPDNVFRCERKSGGQSRAGSEPADSAPGDRLERDASLDQ